MPTSALVIVDLQNDFMPDGGLPVAGGDEVVPVINRLQSRFDLVVATQDWHPPDHVSFATNHPGKHPGDVIQLNGIQQALWPVHCVQNTSGASLVDELDKCGIERVFRKGVDSAIDDYSGFYDNEHLHSTGLSEFLNERNVGRVFLAGLATDVCVKYTALDACQLGFETRVIADACRGVGFNPGDPDAALEEMKQAGALIVNSGDILR